MSDIKTQKRMLNGVLPLALYVCISIFLTHRLLLCVPWIGADTYPIYPRTLSDIILAFLSPWSHYFGRSVLGPRIPYLLVLKEILYFLFGVYAQYVLVILWLIIAAYGMYIFIGLFSTSRPARILSGLIYITSTFVWHEMVHSIYGMLGAYASTPWFLFVIFKVIASRCCQAKMKYRMLSTITKSILIGLLIGIVSLSTLFPYYAIFTLFLWTPLTISLIIAALIEKSSLRMPREKLIALILILASFYIPYIITWKAIEMTSIESFGLRPTQELLKIKIADFSYNYRFNNPPYILWFVYPLSYLPKMLGSTSLIAVIVTLQALIIVIYITELLRNSTKISAQNNLMSRVFPIIGLTIVLAYIILATHIAKNTALLKNIWSNSLIALMLAAITQPIKIGIPISLFETIIITFVFDNVVNARTTHLSTRLLKLRKLKLTYSLMTLTMLILIVTTLILYSLKPPITQNNVVREEYFNSLNELLKIQEETQFSHAFNPYVYIEKTRGFLRYYYTYGVALRPFALFGPYAKHLDIRMSELLDRTSIEASIVAKTLYISLYIDKNGHLHKFNFDISPIYIVIPIAIRPYNFTYYLKALSMISDILSANETLAQEYLKSRVVIDFIPQNLSFKPILNIIFTNAKGFGQTNGLANRSNTVIVLEGNSSTITIHGSENVILTTLQEAIQKYKTLSILSDVNVMSTAISVRIIALDTPNKGDEAHVKHALIVRLNERYSPYWVCYPSSSCVKVSIHPFFNFYVVKIDNAKTYITISHRLWPAKVIFTLLSLTIVAVALFYTVKRL